MLLETEETEPSESSAWTNKTNGILNSLLIKTLINNPKNNNTNSKSYLLTLFIANKTRASPMDLLKTAHLFRGTLVTYRLQNGTISEIQFKSSNAFTTVASF